MNFMIFNIKGESKMTKKEMLLKIKENIYWENMFARILNITT